MQFNYQHLRQSEILKRNETPLCKINDGELVTKKALPETQSSLFDFEKLNELFLKEGLNSLLSTLKELQNQGVINQITVNTDSSSGKTVIFCEYDGIKYEFVGASGDKAEPSPPQSKPKTPIGTNTNPFEPNPPMSGLSSSGNTSSLPPDETSYQQWLSSQSSYYQTAIGIASYLQGGEGDPHLVMFNSMRTGIDVDGYYQSVVPTDIQGVFYCDKNDSYYIYDFRNNSFVEIPKDKDIDSQGTFAYGMEEEALVQCYVQGFSPTGQDNVFVKISFANGKSSEEYYTYNKNTHKFEEYHGEITSNKVYMIEDYYISDFDRAVYEMGLENAPVQNSYGSEVCGIYRSMTPDENGNYKHYIWDPSSKKMVELVGIYDTENIVEKTKDTEYEGMVKSVVSSYTQEAYIATDIAGVYTHFDRLYKYDNNSHEFIRLTDEEEERVKALIAQRISAPAPSADSANGISLNAKPEIAQANHLITSEEPTGAFLRAIWLDSQEEKEFRNIKDASQLEGWYIRYDYLDENDIAHHAFRPATMEDVADPNLNSLLYRLSTDLSEWTDEPGPNDLPGCHYVLGFDASSIEYDGIELDIPDYLRLRTYRYNNMGYEAAALHNGTSSDYYKLNPGMHSYANGEDLANDLQGMYNEIKTKFYSNIPDEEFSTIFGSCLQELMERFAYGCYYSEKSDSLHFEAALKELLGLMESYKAPDVQVKSVSDILGSDDYAKHIYIDYTDTSYHAENNNEVLYTEYKIAKDLYQNLGDGLLLLFRSKTNLNHYQKEDQFNTVFKACILEVLNSINLRENSITFEDIANKLVKLFVENLKDFVEKNIDLWHMTTDGIDLRNAGEQFDEKFRYYF